MPVGGNGIARREELRLRVILCGDVEAGWKASDLPFEVLRCQDAMLLADLCRGDLCWGVSTVLLVDLALFPENTRFPEFMSNLKVIHAIAIGDMVDEASCERLLRAGFAGLLRRNGSAATMIRAVSSVVNGQLWFPRGTVSRVLRGFLAGKDPNQLTPREMEILALIGGGLSNQQIADKLFISRETVRWHVRGLYSKLGIEDRRRAKEYLRTMHVPAGIPVQSAARREEPRRARAAS